MTPTELQSVNVGQQLYDINTGRFLTVIFSHKFPNADALLVAVPKPDSFSVIIGTDKPVPAGQHLVREYIGEFRLKVVTNDRQAVHQANVAIISGIDAHRWEATR